MSNSAMKSEERKPMKILTGLLLGTTLITGSLRASVVVLKDGERITGTFVNVQGGNLTYKSDTLGQVTIPVAKIKSFTASKPAVIVRTDRTTARGRLKLLPSGNWQITENGRTQEVPASKVNVIMPESQYATLVSHKAAPWQDWKGNANFGYNLETGNQQSHVISFNVAATRERPATPIFIHHFRTDYSLLMLYSTVKQSGSSITANTLTTNLREDYLFTAGNFVFVSAELDHIQPQGLYLRQTYGGGFGRDLIHSARTKFSVLAGLTFVNQKLYTVPPSTAPAPPAAQYAEALVGETLDMALTKRLHLTHLLNFYPNLTSTGQYYFDTTTGLAMTLTSRITGNVNFVDEYLSNPVAGSHKNNVALTLGAGITF
jgi:putative salt-induced outer membrane protein YdiY